jgi:hypothetical protein
MNKSQQPILSPAEQEILEQLTVRLIRPQERARFDELIIQEHYLHSAELGRRATALCGRISGPVDGVAGVERRRV